VKPVMIAVVLQALWALGRTAVRSRTLVVLGAVAAIASLARVNELVVLLAGGLASALAQRSLARNIQRGVR